MTPQYQVWWSHAHAHTYIRTHAGIHSNRYGCDYTQIKSPHAHQVVRGEWMSLCIHGTIYSQHTTYQYTCIHTFLPGRQDESYWLSHRECQRNRQPVKWGVRCVKWGVTCVWGGRYIRGTVLTHAVQVHTSTSQSATMTYILNEVVMMVMIM